MALDSITPAAAHVAAPSGRVIAMPEGSRLVFGRGPDADLTISAGRGAAPPAPGGGVGGGPDAARTISAGRGLSRRAGVVTAVSGGAWVANISRTHALYAEGDGYRIRLPRMEQHGEPSRGWFIRVGTTLVGSRNMLDEGKALHVVVAGQGVDLADAESARLRLDGEATLLPLYLDPMTKLFLVALMWCQPWLEDPSRTTPLPRTPEIARAALEATGAYHELERFDGDPVFRDRLSARVAEHVKVLRRKISDRGLVRADTRLSDEVVVQVLLEHGIITVADL